MLNEILTTIIKWIIPTILTIILGAITAKAHKIIGTYQQGKQKDIDAAKEEIISEIVDRVAATSNKADIELQDQINNIQNQLQPLIKGILSIQGKQFKDHCRELLDTNTLITLNDWEQIEKDHEAYNGLGGNHEGDLLFDLVKKKYDAQTVAATAQLVQQQIQESEV